MPFSGFSSGILLCSYGNFSSDLFRSASRLAIPRLCDYEIQVHLFPIFLAAGKQQEAVRFEPSSVFFLVFSAILGLVFF